MSRSTISSRLDALRPVTTDALLIASKAVVARLDAFDDMVKALEDVRTALLADYGAKGGLNEESRKRAAGIVRAALARAKHTPR